MNIDSIKDGIVIDHIKPKNALTIYNALKLEELDCSVAMITNAKSKKMGRKDIIKIDKNIDLDLDILGFLDSNITINIIEPKSTAECVSVSNFGSLSFHFSVQLGISFYGCNNTRDGSLCQMYFLTIPKLEPVSRLTCRMEPPACRSAANASAF